VFISLLWATNSLAVTEKQACDMWSNVALKMASERDAGVPISVWKKRINGIETSPGGVTENNLKLMRALLTNVYIELKDTTPELVELSMFKACMTTW
jgi:hypothetical protein